MVNNEAELLEVVKAARHALGELAALNRALVIIGRSSVAQAVDKDIALPIAKALANLDRKNP